MTWGAVAVAGATVVSGALGSSAAGRAASTQADAARQAGDLQAQSARESLDFQREMYNQQRADISPYRQAGLSAQNQLLTYLGINPTANAVAPVTQFDQQGYDRAMDEYYASQQASGPTAGTFTPGYLQDSGMEGGGDTWVEAKFTPGRAASPAASRPMPTREQFTTTIPVDQLQVDPNSPDFGRYAGDFTPSAETVLPDAFTPSAEAALPDAFTGQVNLQADPGYQFRLSEGLKALDRQAAARGGLISGSALKGAQRFGQDMASQEYGNAYNRALTEYGAGVDRSNTMFGRELTGYGSQVDRANTMLGREFDIFQANRTNALNPLMSITGYGQLATNTLGGYGSNLASNAANTMAAGSAAQANALGAAGQAQASGYVGQANALSATLGGLSNIGNQYLTSRNSAYRSPYGPSGSPSIYGSGPITQSTNYFGE